MRLLCPPIAAVLWLAEEVRALKYSRGDQQLAMLRVQLIGSYSESINGQITRHSFIGVGARARQSTGLF